MARRKAAGKKPLPGAKAIIDAMGDGLVLFDMERKITAVNPAFEKMTGYKRSEIIGKDYVECALKIIKSEDTERFTREFVGIMAGKLQPPLLITFVTKDGREIPIICTVSFIKDAKGKPFSVIIVCNDITELKRLQENKEKSNTMRIEELEKFAKVAVGRELKMVELKERIKELEEKLREITGKW